MPQYLIQSAYTPEALQALIKNPQNRAEVIRSAVERLGGKLDGITIVEVPTSVDAAALALAAAAGGSCKGVKTTALLTTEEMIEAVKRASTTGYKPIAAAATAGKSHR